MKKWLPVIRPPFLFLSLALAFLGASITWYEYREYGSPFHTGYAFLGFIGIILAHISVNVFNEYFDYKSGVDFKTQRTPFSGGSGALPGELITKNQALWLGTGTLIAIIPIGIYFLIVHGLWLLPLLVVAAICIVLYTPLILKLPWPEWAPGIGLGVIPVLGMYFIQSGTYTVPAIIASIPSGILVHNLLLLNEFPDVEADMTDNQKTLPITIGKRKASYVYSALTIVVYLWIIGAVAAGQMPVFALLGLLTIPWAVKAIRGALKYDDMNQLIPAMANNVMVVLLTQAFMGVGYILAGIF